jgi:uncharacterized protein YlxW (UPF0749 family)
MKNNRWHIPITVVFLFLGILLSLQFYAQNRFASDLSMQKTENLIAMVRNFSDKRHNLALEIIDLENQLKPQLASQQDDKKLTESINLEMDKLRIVNGTTPLKGPGLTVTFTDTMPVVYADLVLMVNELWAAGAEAISINGYRITNQSAIFSVDDGYNMYIAVDNHKLDYPIIINALGDSNNLDKGLTLPGGFVDKFLSDYKVYPQLQKVSNIVIPGIQMAPVYHYLHEYKQ